MAVSEIFLSETKYKLLDNQSDRERTEEQIRIAIRQKSGVEWTNL